MLFQNLKRFIQNLIEEFIGRKCPSGLGHRIPKHETGDCNHWDCVEIRLNAYKEANTSSVVIEGFPIEGPTPAIDKITSIMNQLEALNESIDALQDYSNKAFQHGLAHGINMEREKLFYTLQISKQLLLDTVQGMGVTSDQKVQQFVTWYETKRERDVNPRQDIVTYKTCTNILALTAAMTELQQSDVQLT
jgi:hypothetical protein